MNIDAGLVLQIIGVVIGGVALPVILNARRESRESIHKLRDQIQTMLVSIARLEERDKITEMLDKRLPKA